MSAFRRAGVLTVAVAVAGLLLAVAAACGSGGDSAGPRLALDGDSFELGEIKTGQLVQRSLEFSNSGDAPLEVGIVKVRPAPDATCGCGVEEYRVRPATVGPGEKGELVFTLRAPQGMEGMEDRMVVELRSNDPSSPDRTITLVFTMSP